MNKTVKLTKIETTGKAGKTYTLAFDEDGILDTIECNGVFIVSTTRVAQTILKNADAIYYGKIPAGFVKAKS